MKHHLYFIIPLLMMACTATTTEVSNSETHGKTLVVDTIAIADWDTTKGTNITYEQSFTITPSGSDDRVKLIVLIPRDVKNRQHVNNITYSYEPDEVYDLNNNRYAKFNWHNVSTPQSLTIEVNINLYRNDLETRSAAPSNDEAEELLEAERFIEVGEEAIQQQAKKLEKGTPFKTVQSIYKFVNNKIDYTGYNGSDMGALSVLESRGGDCSEYCDLMVALCRANGISARVIEGYTTAYANVPKHCWVEVYLKEYGWVLFDPTPGNRSTFTTMKKNYIQLSVNRNDDHLGNYHYWYYRYWGDPITVEDRFTTLEFKP